MSVSWPILEMRGICKRFGGTQALADVSLDVCRGEVLALIGENGAGKSTLMKVLSGAHLPDSGEMILDQAPYRPSSPHVGRELGVAMIYQELTLAPDLSVEDNIMLGREYHRGGWIRRADQRRVAREALDRLGHGDVNPRGKVARLSVGTQQLIEIARALVFDAKVLVLDEPTSSLPRRDVDQLFRVVDRLRGEGLGIVYISHFLEEVRQVSDRYFVLRDGRNAGGGQLSGATDAEIVAAMVGRSVQELFPRIEHAPGETILDIHALSGERMPRAVNLQVRRGEILGIAGLVGAGRTELLRLIYGLDAVASGELRVAGNVPGAGPRGRVSAGIGLVSEDRKTEGLAQGLSIADNLTLSRLGRYSRGGWLRVGARRQAVADWMRRLSVKARSAEQAVQELSGGNQQKVAIARLLHQDADILLLDEPTRGIDVGTKADIYRLMGQAAAQGKAILFVSSYLPELMAVCDQIAVMSRGQLRSVRPISDWTEESVMASMIAGESLA